MHGYMIHLSNLIKRKKIENAHLFPLSSNNSCSNSQSSVGSNLLIFCHGSGLCWSRRSTWRRGSTGRWSTSGWTSSPASPCSRSPSAFWQSSRRSRSFPRSHSSLYLCFCDKEKDREKEHLGGGVSLSKWLKINENVSNWKKLDNMNPSPIQYQRITILDNRENLWGEVEIG